MYSITFFLLSCTKRQLSEKRIAIYLFPVIAFLGMIVAYAKTIVKQKKTEPAFLFIIRLLFFVYAWLLVETNKDWYIADEGEKHCYHANEN